MNETNDEKIVNDDSPRIYGVPHDEWRPNQYVALQKTMQAYKESKNTAILEMGTGSGKSAVGSALGREEKVVIYAHSLGLIDQYRDKYNLAVVKGMSNYHCVNDDIVTPFQERVGRLPTVADCPYDPMHYCPVYDRCPYVIARNNALAAQRMACTYAFAMLSQSVRDRPGIAVWDEAHSAADVIVGLSSITLTQSMIEDFGLPRIPLYGVHDAVDKKRRDILLDWLHECSVLMSISAATALPDELSKRKRVKQKIEFALDELERADYYMESSDTEKAGKRKYKKPQQFLMLKPFTASRFSWKLREGKKMSVLMSATIGDPVPLTEELGIDNYVMFDFPHPVPADKRPIYDLEFERMTWGNLQKIPMLPRLQAMRIADFIDSLPHDWRGLIVTSSYKKMNELRSNMRNLLGDRIFIPPDDRPNKRIEAFLKDDRSGIISVDLIQSWGTGIDLYGDLGRFVVVAGLPFKVTKDPFEKARNSRYGAKYGWWQAYMAAPQAAGRVSRGEIDEDGKFMLNVAAFADGSTTTTRALKSYPHYIREAIVPWK